MSDLQRVINEHPEETRWVIEQFNQRHPELWAITEEAQRHNGTVVGNMFAQLVQENAIDLTDPQIALNNLEAAHALALQNGQLRFDEPARAAVVPLYSPTPVKDEQGRMGQPAANEDEFLAQAPLADVRNYLEKKYASPVPRDVLAESGGAWTSRGQAK